MIEKSGGQSGNGVEQYGIDWNESDGELDLDDLLTDSGFFPGDGET